jgi:hypothetical protein
MEVAVTAKILSYEELVSKVVYHPETGLFSWKKDHEYAKTIKAGDVISPNARSMGYRVACINKVRFYQHKLVWLYVHKQWPDRQIDHINGDKSDNRIENLRLATHSQNQHNRKKLKSRSGLVGAYRSSRGNTWYSTIMANNKKNYLGTFKTAEEAAQAYAKAKKELHPFCPDVPSR